MPWWTGWWSHRGDEQQLERDYLKLAGLALSWDEAWTLEENQALLALEETGVGG